MSNGTKWEPITGGTTYMKVSSLVDNEFVGTFDKSIDTQFGKTHLFVTDRGSVGINGCGALDFKLTSIKNGDTIKILYKGKKEGTGKMAGKSFHELDVLKAVA